MNNSKVELLSVLGLLLAAILWGTSYPATKIVEHCPTFYTVSIRFIIAAIVLCLLYFKKITNMNHDILKYSFLLSFFIIFMYVFATLGIKYTTSSRASFFTCLTFIMVPLLNLIFFKMKLTKITLISVLICLGGIFLLSYQPSERDFSLNRGDLLCMLASLAGSLHIIFLDRITKNDDIDPMLFTTFLMIFVAVWGTLVALFKGDYSSYAVNTTEFLTIAFLGIFCSAAAFLLQSICQKCVPSNRVGVILAMEPASGCVISVIMLKEAMSSAGWIGAILIMISLLYMEISTNKLNHFNNKPPTQ
ncbi:DMT family transporter [Aminicella lysinilytica]|uniref:Drug/metabolite transporter (DMT)-like permease n=1 Tax=Aminicella lysinilytica TaxID=433323 RepID=A0A4R6Q0L1_9FIRM|nr:DMT family transporter [Aminicella lysinilytica]TDP48643.1 drug/metabolite transporter (DMT)-like permease [Aminicella lysinilytica]